MGYPSKNNIPNSCFLIKSERVASFVLAVFLLLGSIHPAFAQSEDASSETSSQDSSTVDTSTTESSNTVGDVQSVANSSVSSDPNVTGPEAESSEANVEQTEELETFDTESQQSLGLSEGSSGNSDGDSGIESALESISSFDGSYTHSLPIKVPPGRSGLQPDMTLSYNSNQGSDDDIFGYGWSINIPYIARVNKTGIEDMYDNNVFYSSLSGELVQIGSSDNYRPKNENGDFLQYEFVDDTWIVTGKDGATYSFGSATSSRQDNVASTTQIYKWMLNEVRDTNDNSIIYTYFKADNQIYPENIFYTGHGTTTDGDFEVDFTLESISVNSVRYNTGFAATTSYRVDKIEALYNDNWVHKYDFTYTAGDNGARSVLQSITESGRTEDGVTTVVLPAMDVDYTHTMGTGWTEQSSTWSIPEGFAGYDDAKDLGTRAVDINGDGYTDIIRYYQRSGYPNIKKIYLNNTEDGWDLDTEWDWSEINIAITTYSSYGSNNPRHDNGIRFADVNGDGLVDVLIGRDYTTDTKKVYINDGSGWHHDSSWTLPVFFTGLGYNRLWDAGARIGDVNGDGLPDIVQSVVDNDGDITSENVYINTGSGWTSNNTWVVPEGFVACYTCTSRTGEDRGVRLVDINNDGLADIIRAFRDSDDTSLNKKIVYLNNGVNWATTTEWTIPFYFLDADANPSDRGYRLGDINGDRLPDVVAHGDTGYFDVRDLYINTGTGWTNSIGVAPPGVIPFVTSDGDLGTRLVDINADGLPDLIQSTNETDTATGTTNYNVFINARKTGDLVEDITNQQGGEIGIVYKAGGEYKDESDDLLNPELPYPINTVSTITFDPQIGDSWSTAYEYSGGKLWFDENYKADRKFAGFNTVSATSNFNEHKYFYHQGTTTDAVHGEYDDHFSKIGQLYRSEVNDLDGNKHKVVINKWNSNSLGDGSFFVKKENTVTLNFDGDSDHKDTATSYSYDDTHGSMLSQTEWGEVIASTTGTFSDTSTDKRITTYSYATNTAGIVVPSNITVTDNGSSKVREQKFYYDSQALGEVSSGNLTKQENWIEDSTYADREWTYNEYGLVINETDPRDNTTTHTYDIRNLHIATSTDAEGLIMAYTHDYSSGKVEKTINPNGQVFESIYDPLDRPKYEYIPDPVSGSSVLKTSITYTDTQGAVSVEKENLLNSATSSTEYAYIDGFGKIIQERKQAEDSSQYVVRDFIYRDGELLEKESLPYFSSGTTRTNPTANNNLYTEYGYDALSRVVVATTSVGTTMTTYDQWLEIVTDSNDNEKDYLYDAFGRLTQVTEHNGTSTYNTTYEWDDNNNLVKITDALGNVRNIEYDGLSRRTSLEDLHDSGDGSYGEWSFNYDNAGNLTSQTDPMSQTISYTYDDINRILTEDYLGQSGVEKLFTYDSCANGNGFLCSVASAVSTTTYTYTDNGQVETQTEIIDGETYVTTYEYDRQNNKTLVKYPDNSEVKYAYNTANKVEAIEQKENGGLFSDVVTSMGYAPTGEVSQIVHANGATTTYYYDEDNLYRLYRLVTIATSTAGMGGDSEGLSLSSEDFFLSLISTTTEATSSPTVQLESDTEIISSQQSSSTGMTLAGINDLIEDFGSSTEQSSFATSTATTTINLSGDPSFSNVDSEESVDVLGDGQVGRLSTTTQEVSEITSTLVEKLKYKDAKEKAKIKSEAIVNTVRKGIYIKDDEFSYLNDTVSSKAKGKDKIKIEIVDIEAIDGGVQVFARVWEKGKQIGFGKDGTVDVERFRIFNPPILVADDNGLVTLGESYIDPMTGEYIENVRKVKEDPQEALLQIIESTLPAKKEVFDDSKIVSGKVGNTTSIFYPDADPETNTVDGVMWSFSNAGWSTVRSGAGSKFAYPSLTNKEVHAGRRVNTNWLISRATFLFDTSPIGSDDISNVDLSFYASSLVDGVNDSYSYLTIVSADPASNTNLSTSDWNHEGSVEYVDSGDREDITTISTSAYTNMTLNATGTSAVNPSGISKFALLSGHDLYDQAINTPGDYDQVFMYFAEQSGTTNDPKLVIEHSGSEVSTSSSSILQDLNYEYDSVGNITSVVSRSDIAEHSTTTYIYDDLYRLLSASTTNASSSGYVRDYSYNAIGNITYKSDQGSYLYQGDIGGSYANPHAVTSVNGVTYTYDNNGNLTSIGSSATNSWTYRNELAQSVVGSSTISYGYGNSGNRVWKDNDTLITYYPFSNYEITDTGSTTKHIYVDDRLVATIEGSGGGALTYHNHLDHLGSTKVVTDGIGSLDQSLTYYPFGSTLANNQYGSQNQTKRYTGHYYDEETDLSYMGARYYGGQVGRFTAQDPLSLNIGSWKEFEEDASVPLYEWIRDPQRLNTYSYAGNNPIKNIDKDGKDYYSFSADLSVQPYSVSASLKFDPQKLRLDASVGGGPAGGSSAVLSATYNPNDLPNENSYIIHEAFVAGGYYFGGKFYLENQPFKDGSFSDMSLSVGGNVGLGTGIGISTGVQASYNHTLIDLSKALNSLKGLLSRFGSNQSKESQDEESGKKKNNKDNN